MRFHRRILDQWSMEHATDSGITYAELNIARALSYLLDKDKKTRLERLECRWCFYWESSRIGGAAMTNWLCGVCAKEQMHGSTAVPRLCNPCGKKHELCVECGGDLHQRRRRKWNEIPVVETPKEYL